MGRQSSPPQDRTRQGRSNRQSEDEKGQKSARSRRRTAEAVEGRVHSVEAARLLLIAWVVRGEMSYPHFQPFSSRTAVTRGQRRGRGLERWEEVKRRRVARLLECRGWLTREGVPTLSSIIRTNAGAQPLCPKIDIQPHTFRKVHTLCVLRKFHFLLEIRLLIRLLF